MFRTDRYVLRDRKVKDWMAGAWARGFVDVRATASKKVSSDKVGECRGGGGAVRNYILKDLLKAVMRTGEDREVKDVNTLALNWLYRRQSFAISGSKLLEGICLKNGIDLISILCNSNHDLDLLDDFEGYVYLGICRVRAYEGLDPPWRFDMDRGVLTYSHD